MPIQGQSRCHLAAPGGRSCGADCLRPALGFCRSALGPPQSVTCSFSLRLMALWGLSFIGNQFKRSSPRLQAPLLARHARAWTRRRPPRPETSQMSLLDVEFGVTSSGECLGKIWGFKIRLAIDFQVARPSSATQLLLTNSWFLYRGQALDLIQEKAPEYSGKDSTGDLPRPCRNCVTLG